MQTTRVGETLRVQIPQFLEMLSPHFSKPKMKFLEQMLFGVSASQDCKLSQVARVLGESIWLKKTEERLSRHLATPGLGRTVQQQIVAHAARRVGADTLIVVDPTDTRKPYAQAMPHLATVRDGSTGALVPGDWACVALACEPERQRVLPLMQELWSAQAPDFENENTQRLSIIDTVAAATAQRGVYVLDRSGDRMKLYEPLLARGLRFIIRLRGDRHWVRRGRARRADDLARGARMRYAETVVREAAGGEKKVHLEDGFVRVRLPGRRDVELALVEETIRFIKQSYRLEDLRVPDYERLRNLAALVMAAACFAAVWLGESLKLAVLASRVSRMAKQFFGVPEFQYYALADGISVLRSHLGVWCPLCRPSPAAAISNQQHVFAFG